MVQHRIVLVNEYVSRGLTDMGRQLTRTTASQTGFHRSLTLTQQRLMKNAAGIKQLQSLQRQGIPLTVSQTRHLGNLRKGYVAMGGSLSAITMKSKGLLLSLTKLRWTFVNLAMAAALAYGAFRIFIKPAIDFETELANVQKTTGFTNEEMEGMAMELRNLSTIIPVTANELAQIATVAGQLGIAMKGGTDAIISFTTAVSMMAVATDMTAEEAATNMAKVAQAFGFPISQVLALGSVINELENTTAARAGEIASSLRRVGASAAILGISFEQSAAAVSTLIGAGMRAERAGTRLRSLFGSMAKNVEAFAEIAGVSTKEFIVLMETDADRALQMVVTGLSNTSLRTEMMKNALDAAGKVGGFALITLADNAEAFTTNLKTANDEMSEATSLIEEMGIKAETTAGQWALLANTIKEKFLDPKGMFADFIAGARMMLEVGVWDMGRAGAEFTKIIDEETIALIALARESGKSGEEIDKMLIKIFEKERPTFILDAIRQYTELLTGIKDAGEGMEEPKQSIEEIEEAIDNMADGFENATMSMYESITALRDFEKETGILVDSLNELKILQDLVARGVAVTPEQFLALHPERAREYYGLPPPAPPPTYGPGAVHPLERDDFISRPGQPIQMFSPQDTVFGVKEAGKAAGGTTIGEVTIIVQGYNQDPRKLAIEIDRQMNSLA